MNRAIRIIQILLVVMLLSNSTMLIARAQTPTPVADSPVSKSGDDQSLPPTTEDLLEAQLDALMENMTAADRIGQLFMITFEGDDTSFDSDIAELVHGYRIGGVVLSPQRGNFSNEKGVDTPEQVAVFTNQLQALVYGVLLRADQALREPPAPSGSWEVFPALEDLTHVPPLKVPLFIAVEQFGDNLPATSLRRGFTPVPSQMAIGATWNSDLARSVGEIVGRELSAVGVNMLLGPSLDTLVLPQPGPVGSLGIHTFGGDPYWVAQMGRAYISGVHEGSDRGVVTISRHFPGAGDIDRMPEEEVATVQRNLQELQRVTLPPFLAVTRQASSILHSDGDPAATDGMMSSHTRYSGFQGAGLGRNTPLSLAPELEMVLEQEGFAQWREQGGILVSSGLGDPAIRRHYSPSLEEFPFRRVAMDAFTAGHDLLLLDRFSLDDQWETEKQNIKETIGFFQDRYISDPDFAAQVDKAVRRILRVKQRLYVSRSNGEAPADGTDSTAENADGFGEEALPSPAALIDVLVREGDLEVLAGDSQATALATVSQVAREASTILSPDPSSSSEIVSRVPQSDDQLLIVTDSRLVRECNTCIAEAAVGPDEIADIIDRLYGSGATGQLSGDQVVSLTFADLAELLEAENELAAEPETPETTATVVVETPSPESETVVETAESAVFQSDAELDKREKIDRLIEQADWLIFAMLDVDSQLYPQSDVVKRFLRQRSDQLASKRVVVLALHAPYFLDATEISNLNGYYGIYSKTKPFLESAVRALFRTFPPAGAPPISVAGTRFGNLAERLQPDSTRPVDLRVLSGESEVAAGEVGAESAPLPTVDAGTVIRVRAGPVYDLNGKPVHDGMAVNFHVVYEGDDTAGKVESAPTRDGVAARDILLENGGVVQISAQVGEAASSASVAMNVQGGIAATPVTEVAGTSEVALVPDPMTDTLAVAAELPALPVDSEAAPTDAVPDLQDSVGLISLFIALITIVATLSMLLIVQVRVLPRQTLVHSMLWAVNCGLVAYIVYSVGWVPGATWLQGSLKVWGGAIVVFIAMLLPLLWLQLRPD